MTWEFIKSHIEENETRREDGNLRDSGISLFNNQCVCIEISYVVVYSGGQKPSLCVFRWDKAGL
jgi:hypothetical protein